MANTDWNKIREEWETSKITLKALAEKHSVKLGTLKSRKSRESWSKNYTEKDATSKKDATQKNKKDATLKKESKKKRRYKKGSRKGAGNPSPDKKFTKRNSAALKHGLFSRYIPQEMLDIMGTMEKDNPADIIWDQIMIQYAAIIRAQKIMFVTDKHEIAKELKKLKVDSGLDQEGNIVQTPTEKEYEIQFAWDRHANFMNAQSRAIGELRSSIKQFLEMAHNDDERRLKLEQMQAGIEKTNAEIESITVDKDKGNTDDWIDAIKAVAEKRRVKEDE